MKVPIVLIILFYIYKIKPKRNTINIENYFKFNYLKKNRIEIDRKSIFIIKKSDVDANKNIILNGENILHYPSMKPDMVDVGDIILEGNENKTFVVNFLEFILESDTVHTLSISHFKVDRNYKKNIPNDYYLVIPIIIDSRLRSGTNDNSLYEYFLEESMKSKKILHIMRYKKITEKQKKKFFELFTHYKFTNYNIATYIKFPVVKSIEFFFIILQKIFNLNYYYSKKLFYSTIIYLFGNFDIKYPLPPEKLENINFLIKLNLSKLKNEKDKIKKLQFKNTIKKLSELKYKIREDTNFVCSSFIYYYFNRIGIDVFKNNSYDMNKIHFSQFVYPNQFDEIIRDNRFKYVSSIYTGNNW